MSTAAVLLVGLASIPLASTTQPTKELVRVRLEQRLVASRDDAVGTGNLSAFGLRRHPYSRGQGSGVRGQGSGVRGQGAKASSDKSLSFLYLPSTMWQMLYSKRRLHPTNNQEVVFRRLLSGKTFCDRICYHVRGADMR